MRSRIRVSVVTLVLLLAVILLPACNTMRGAGQDISNTGHAIRDAFTR